MGKVRIGILHGLIGTIVLGIGPVSAQKGKPAAGQRGWHTSLEAAKAQAKATGKPLMVVFRCEP